MKTKKVCLKTVSLKKRPAKTLYRLPKTTPTRARKAPVTTPRKVAEEAAMNERTCIVTRNTGGPDDLIRFVAAPDGQVVPDLKRELPGRGCWVTAERWAVDKAVSKGLYARALKQKVEVSTDIGAMVDMLMARQLAGMMNMARKAGEFVTGSAKVDLAIRSGAALAVFHAADAAADGKRKLDQARKAFWLQTEAEGPIPAMSPLLPWKLTLFCMRMRLNMPQRLRERPERV
nr:RNA-binding protein [Marinicella sp. W31]MDC2875846.1 RNA-binding protein [Marinicella sp. W31]